MLFVILGIIVVVGALLLIFSNFSTGLKRNLPRPAPPREAEAPRSARSGQDDDKVIYLFGESKEDGPRGEKDEE